MKQLFFFFHFTHHYLPIFRFEATFQAAAIETLNKTSDNDVETEDRKDVIRKSMEVETKSRKKIAKKEI